MKIQKPSYQVNTLSSAYSEFGNNEHPPETSSRTSHQNHWHMFEPRLRPRHYQCLWIHLTATSTWVQVAQLPCHIHAYTVYTSWWKRQVVSLQMWPSESPHTNKKECRREIYSGFETHEEGHTKSKTGAISGSAKWASVTTRVVYLASFTLPLLKGHHTYSGKTS